MIKKIFSLLICFGFAISAFSQKIESPAEFLGYQLGTQFTNQYRIADYFKYVAKTSKHVKLVEYGSTNEGRPLLAMFITSDENIGRLEEIRENNVSLAGLGKTPSPTISNPVIVWLSYNVHGNEPSSSEAAMQTLFDMVDPANMRTKSWLKNTVVVIDPCLNPDGHERYVNFYNSVKGSTPDSNPSSREHIEPWPGGRINHYYFDLNRDWAWQVQKESQARMALYNKWLPEIHVDFHEQGYNSPYYFAPAAQPFHKDITAWQKDFQTTIGKNNAKYFDQNGWLYFTREEFDLLYPSYGDTYPIYNGSIGMTYEQGGIGAGLTVSTRMGDVLTLAERIAHHHSNSLSTIEIASANAQKTLEEFKKYFDNSRANPSGDYKTYLVKNDNEDKLLALAKLLDKNGIQYHTGLKASGTGYNYFSGKTEPYNAGPNDMVINAYQSKSVLLNVLFEPKTFVADSNTYDITAWSLSYAFGLRTYGIKESLQGAGSTINKVKSKIAANAHPYAYINQWQSVEDVKFLAALLKEKIKVRYSEKSFEAGGKKFAAGSLIIARAGNDRADLDELIAQLAAKFNRAPIPLASGFVEKGADLGSDVIKYIHPPKIMLIAGDGVSAESMGEIWHFFDQQISYPVTLVRYKDINRIKLSDFDVMIFPDGRYDDLPVDKLEDWASSGGKLVTMGNTVAQLADKKSFGIKRKDTVAADKKESGKDRNIKLYEDRDRESISSNVAGAIYKINLDNTHPLGFGFPNYYYSLKLNDDIYEFLNDGGWNVGTIKKDAYVAGFVGRKSKEKINSGLLLGVQNIGKGAIVFMVDDPLFRGFWENGKLLFGNAVFMVKP